MKRWPWLVAGLYALTLLVLTVPACMAAFAPKIKLTDSFGAFVVWPYWVWLVIMFVSQFALLAVPVRVESRRPITKGALWPTVLVGGLMAGALLIGASFSVFEFIFGEHGFGNWLGWGTIGAGILTWCIWSVIFFRS